MSLANNAEALINASDRVAHTFSDTPAAARAGSKWQSSSTSGTFACVAAKSAGVSVDRHRASLTIPSLMYNSETTPLPITCPGGQADFSYGPVGPSPYKVDSHNWVGRKDGLEPGATRRLPPVVPDKS